MRPRIVLLLVLSALLTGGLRQVSAQDAAADPPVVEINEKVESRIKNLLGLTSEKEKSTAVDSEQRLSTLYWGTGDSLIGSLLSANGDSVIWNSPLFVDPLEIEMSALTSIRFTETKEQYPFNEPFRISMSNGDILFGKLSGATEAAFQFESSRHGKMELHRNKIESVKRMDTPDLIYLGPRGLDGWVSPQNGEDAGWQALTNGRLTTNTPDRAIYRQIDFPEKCEIEMIIESSSIPSFIFAFGQHRNSCLRVESWDDVLVVLSRFQFVEVDTLSDDVRKIHLNLFLDQAENRLSIYTNSGIQLAEIVDDRRFLKPTGIQLWNREGDLTLNYLRVDRWNGQLPKPLKVGQSRIHTSDGNIIYGHVTEMNPETGTITIGEVEERREIAIKDLKNIVVNDNASDESKVNPNSIAWKEGEFVSGKIESVTDGRLLVRTEYSDAPISSGMQNLQRVTMPNSADAPKNTDTLFFDGGTLRGTLVVDDKTDDPIRWTPVGGLNASALNSSGNARFLRGDKGQDLAIDMMKYPDILYLANGDIFPCKLTGVQEETVFVDHPFSNVTEIPSKNVKAIEFSAGSEGNNSGFTDNGWRRLLGRPSSTENELSFKTSGAFGHESIMMGDHVSFRLTWGPQQYSQLIIQLFGERLGNSSDSTNVVIHLNGDQLWIDETSIQQVGNVVRFVNGAPQSPNRSEVIKAKEGKADVSLSIRDGAVQVLIDGKTLKSVPLRDQQIKKRSLAFQAVVNSITRNSRLTTNTLKSGIVIDQFSVQGLNGASAKQFILEETREKTLMIPRFRRDNPSTHVVLAPNGDILRGRLVGIDAEQVNFESQLEQFGFGRERIAAVIWLHPPDTKKKEEEEAVVEQPTADLEMQLRFGKGFLVSMDPEKVEGERLVGQAASLGRFGIPAAAIQEVLLGDATTTDGILSYSHWIPQHAMEPQWELPDESGSSPAMDLIGTTAEDFSLPGIDGTTFKLEEHNDKIIVIDFWASWCGPCVAALPDYVEATSGFNPEKVIFVALNLQESPQVVRQFLKEKRLDPQVAIDETGAVASRFRVSGIPHMVILSPGKVIESVRIGYHPNGGEEVRQTIEKLLAGTWERPKTKAANEDSELEKPNE